MCLAPLRCFFCFKVSVIIVSVEDLLPPVLTNGFVQSDWSCPRRINFSPCKLPTKKKLHISRSRCAFQVRVATWSLVSHHDHLVWSIVYYLHFRISAVYCTANQSAVVSDDHLCCLGQLSSVDLYYEKLCDTWHGGIVCNSLVPPASCGMMATSQLLRFWQGASATILPPPHLLVSAILSSLVCSWREKVRWKYSPSW